MIVKCNPITAYLIDQWKQNAFSTEPNITTITTTKDKPIPLFYANDCNGYLGYYLTQANLHHQFSKEKVNILHIEINDESLQFPIHTYDIFFKHLMQRYPTESDGLTILQGIIQQVGQEWFEFIIEGLDWKKFMTLRHTIKYAELNFMEVVEQHISNEELRELFVLLQPYRGDVGFNTMAGYLYKQLFDMHKMPEFWMSAHHYRGEYETETLEEVEICTFVDDDNAQYKDLSYTNYSIVFHSSDLKLSSVLFTKVNMDEFALNLFLWPYDFVEVDSPQIFKLDVSIPEDFTEFEELHEKLVDKLQNIAPDFEMHNIYTPEDYQNGYGFNQGTGTRWALSAKQAMKLSTKLMSKSLYNHWGYAWFTSVPIFINHWNEKATQYE
ncbi:hypothetical protein [Paenibacillus crassostreae]|uniref:Uncharacterized protein n=1 Tax=Paenibacillus crassostreae TaxID=1763538 RepID=A0A167FB75_9BACL|nr:hypothetical protein [Paenibacillus crassostreae]AOZ90859.1 hypothetical protein LPB68_00655 [Paenibacillus crassostreae]OAB76375.1 hypothetical protein PNBC_02880 [Paenibacillus crassostreae]